MKIILFVEEEYEDLELQYPKDSTNEGVFEEIIAGEKKELYKGRHGYPTHDVTLSE